MKRKKFLISIIAILTIFATMGCSQDEIDKSKANKEIKGIEIIDILNRHIVLEEPPERVIAIGSALRLYTYLADTDMLVGVEKSQQLLDVGRPYIMANPGLSELAIVGEGFPAPVDLELIIEADPDLIIAGDISDIKQIEDIEKKTGIPVVLVAIDDANIFSENIYESLKIIGKVIRREKRAEEVIKYMESCKNEIIELTKDIPDNKKPSVYIGGLSYKGNHGIVSTSGDSPNLNIIGAKNVAQGIGSSNAVIIDKEKLLVWDPEIIVIDESGLSIVMEDYKKNSDFYESLSAVRNGKVYGQLPNVSYYLNMETAMANIYFLGEILYPEEFKHINAEEKADEIYSFMLGKPLYKEMSEKFGGYIKIDLKK